jgi:hypothetical protein
MFLWELTNPDGDGALENNLVTHKVRLASAHWRARRLIFSYPEHPWDDQA